MKWTMDVALEVGGELSYRRYGGPDVEQAVACVEELLAHPCPSWEGTVHAMLEAGHPYLTSIAVELKLLGEI